MSTQFPFATSWWTRVVLMVLFHIGLSGPSEAYSFDVPEKKVLLAESGTIVVCKVYLKDGIHPSGIPTAYVTKVLKGDPDLLNATLLLEPGEGNEMAFPLRPWIKQAGVHKEVILLGNIREKPTRLHLPHALASFWPNGAPRDVSKERRYDECLKVVLDHVKANKEQGGEKAGGVPVR